MSLQGTALAVEDGGCDGKGVYAEIVEVITNSTVMTGLKDMIIDEETLVANGVPKVYGLYADGHISEIGTEYFTVATSSGESSSDKLAAGTNYITVSEDGVAYSLNGTTVQVGYTGEYKIEDVSVG